MTREELIDEIWEAMDDANDMGVGLRDFAKAVATRLEKLGLVTVDEEAKQP